MPLKTTQSNLSEYEHQKAVAKWLHSRKVLFHATLNGLPMGRNLWMRCKASGALKGIPDILIFTAPPAEPQARLVGLEMKKPKGRVSVAQRECHQALEQADCIVLIGYGYDDAVAKLVALGY